MRKKKPYKAFFIAGAAFVAVSFFIYSFSSYSNVNNRKCSFKKSEKEFQLKSTYKILSLDLNFGFGEKLTTKNYSVSSFAKKIGLIKDEIKSLSKEKDIDFVLLQNVDYGSERTFFIDEAHFFSDEIFDNILNCYNINVNYTFLKAVDELPLMPQLGRVLSGNSIFSKYNFESFDNVFLKSSNLNLLKKTYLNKEAIESAVFKTTSGKELIILNLNKVKASLEEENLKQVEIRELINSRPNSPQIVIDNDFEKNEILGNKISILNSQKIYILDLKAKVIEFAVLD